MKLKIRAIIPNIIPTSSLKIVPGNDCFYMSFLNNEGKRKSYGKKYSWNCYCLRKDSILLFNQTGNSYTLKIHVKVPQ